MAKSSRTIREALDQLAEELEQLARRKGVAPGGAAPAGGGTVSTDSDTVIEALDQIAEELEKL